MNFFKSRKFSLAGCRREHQKDAKHEKGLKDCYWLKEREAMEHGRLCLLALESDPWLMAREEPQPQGSESH